MDFSKSTKLQEQDQFIDQVNSFVSKTKEIEKDYLVHTLQKPSTGIILETSKELKDTHTDPDP